MADVEIARSGSAAGANVASLETGASADQTGTPNKETAHRKLGIQPEVKNLSNYQNFEGQKPTKDSATHVSDERGPDDPDLQLVKSAGQSALPPLWNIHGESKGSSDEHRSSSGVGYRLELYSVQTDRVRDIKVARLRQAFDDGDPISTELDTPSSFGSIFLVTSMFSSPRNSQKDAYIFEMSPNEQRGTVVEGPIRVGADGGTILQIRSSAILAMLRQVIGRYPNINLESSSITLPEPFCLLLHYRRELLAFCDSLPRVEDGTETTQDGLLLGKAQYKSKPDHETEHGQLSALLDFVNGKYLHLIDEEEKRYENPEPKCTFQWAWLLFKPGSVVYMWDENVITAYMVESHDLQGLFFFESGTNKLIVSPLRLNRMRHGGFGANLTAIEIRLTYLEFTGEFLGWRRKNIFIHHFDGEIAIASLPAVPAEYWKDSSVPERLLERGKRYYSLTSKTHCQYHGETLSNPRRTVRSRILVDQLTYYNDGDVGSAKMPKFAFPANLIDPTVDIDLSWFERPVKFSRFDAEDSSSIYKQELRSLRNRFGREKAFQDLGLIDPLETPILPDDLLIFCPRRIHGFILSERKWDVLDVESISNIEFKRSMIDDLVVSAEVKNLIQALAHAYTSVSNNSTRPEEWSKKDRNKFHGRWSADFVHGKGEGQIFLLHGKPGVGKTTTAECVAELTEKPLLSITCGDLGTEPLRVERELIKWLDLAYAWQAVLLLDEAEVYLESRERGDLERNSLVTIFLRALEYYQGLLFLTTNRIGTFDDALISRIHVIIHYPDFTDHEREKIWQTSFRKLDDEREDIKIGLGVMEYAWGHSDVKALGWNGREIRNAFKTMVALAEWDSRVNNKRTRDNRIELRKEHLEQVVKMSASFKDYLKSTRGFDESTNAKIHLLRDDEFVPQR